MRFFHGHRVLVTGGSSGIGRATALALARAGAHVAVTARRREPLEATCDALRAAARGPDQRFSWTAFDVADPAAAAEGVGRSIEALGGLDLLVNNAGVARALRFEDTPLDAYRRLIDVNFLGTVYVTRAALPRLMAQRSGHVVNVSSLAGLVAIYGYTAYAPSKFAVTGFSEALRQELRPHGIGVSVVFPPDTDTPQLAAEDLEKPPETRAVAGTVPPLHADTVASAILRGVARRRFWIVPSWRARLVALASRHFPPLVRLVIDRDIARTRRDSHSSAISANSASSANPPADPADTARHRP
jgi:3-dehydrosphinganine reductase